MNEVWLSLDVCFTGPHPVLPQVHLQLLPTYLTKKSFSVSWADKPAKICLNTGQMAAASSNREDAELGLSFTHHEILNWDAFLFLAANFQLTCKNLPSLRPLRLFQSLLLH